METLEIVIGMVFIYLLLSLLATIVQELWASLISLRGQILLKAVAKLLEIENQSEVTGESKEKLMSHFKKQIQESKVYQKYSDRYLWIKQLPSYLSADQVTGIIKELLEKNITPDTTPTPEIPDTGERSLTFQPAQIAPAQPTLLANMQQDDLKKQLNIIYQNNASTTGTRSLEGGDNAAEETVVDKAKAAFKKQYDEIMDRATGWYKRSVQMSLIVIGFIISLAIDADTFKIYGNLTHYPEDRQKLLQLAEDFSQNNKIAIYTPDSIEAIQLANDNTKPAELRKLVDSILLNEIQNVPSPLGLGRPNLAIQSPPAGVNEWLWRGEKFLGWLVTALAISLGAPFWFDLLQKLIHIRNAGNRPQDADKKRNPAPAQDE